MPKNYHAERSYFYSFSLSRRILLFSETNYVASKRHLLARYCCFWWQESGIDGGAFTQTSVFFVRIILVFFVYIIIVFCVRIIIVILHIHNNDKSNPQEKDQFALNSKLTTKRRRLKSFSPPTIRP